MHDRQQITRGTVGEGTITIRDKAYQQQDVAATNDDATKVQITKILGFVMKLTVVT